MADLIRRLIDKLTPEDREEHNNKLIDLCFDEAVKVCRRAEGFESGGFIDWDLPTHAQFRTRVRQAREHAYRKEAKRA